MGCIVNKGQRPVEFCKVVNQETGAAPGKDGGGIDKDDPAKDEPNKTKDKRSAASGDVSAEGEPPLQVTSDADILLPWQVADSTFSGGPSKTINISNGATHFIHCSTDGCKTLEIPNGATVETFNTWVRVRYKGKNGFIPAKTVPLSPRPSESRQQIRVRHDSVDAERREAKRKETQIQLQQGQQAHSSSAKAEDRLYKIRQWIDRKPPHDVPCTVSDGEGLTVLSAANIQQNLLAIRQYNEKFRAPV
eukprot:TRINITY_DN246_c11_g1_i1.p1 TRINITY_DN246_c11_g1~~TRINITY_DN246_c11_g1_i1.p1  ORF type:complete len:248 (+),score=41.95 TRINITY_DN246_c11_g1_i1:83-826(+)